MLLHDGARGDLLGALAVTAGALGGLFDVFVLPLFFGTGTADVTFYCHKLVVKSSRKRVRRAGARAGCGKRWLG